MSLIDVRIFKAKTRIGGIEGLEVVGDPQLTDEQVWDISLAQVIAVNALAVPAERRLSYRVLRHELRLLLSFLSDHAGIPLSLRHDAFWASAGHIKRLVSESLGLGMLTATAERYHRWQLQPGDLGNFDALPAKLASQYPGAGIRPDLLFDFTSQGQERRLAGEARGRSSVRPRRPSKSQLNRLAEIVAWSGRNDIHPVTMTYAFTWADNVQVDLFNVVIPGDADTAAPPPEAADEQEMLAVEPSRPQRRFEALQSIRPPAIDRVAQISDELYETAPESPSGVEQSVFGRNVRGTWTAANLFASADLRFFLGVLDQSLSPEEAAASRQRMRSQEEPDADPIQVAATQRIIAAVSRGGTTAPNWSEVASRLEGHA